MSEPLHSRLNRETICVILSYFLKDFICLFVFFVYENERECVCKQGQGAGG